jgi:SOS-response transcriptional repressor LexA
MTDNPAITSFTATPIATTVRPTKKQRELLAYIETFIGEHGYSPSYREIMNGLHYNSVATVALHVGSLIKRGHLRKRDYSARSLEVVTPSESLKSTTSTPSNEIKPGEEKWLIEKIEHFFSQLEQSTHTTQPALDELYVLVGALKVLGLEGAASSFMPRISALKKLTQKTQEAA